MKVNNAEKIKNKLDNFKMHSLTSFTGLCYEAEFFDAEVTQDFQGYIGGSHLT